MQEDGTHCIFHRQDHPGKIGYSFDMLHRSYIVQLPQETLYTSGFLVAKLLKWGIDNEAGLEKILIDCAIPPYVFQ